MKYVVLENIRSAYNTWNILRTADALWRTPIISGFTPHWSDQKVQKTALWAFVDHDEQYYFWNPAECLSWLQEQWVKSIAMEITEWSVPIDEYTSHWSLALIMWNENTWVLEETLEHADSVVYIPMQGSKESMNVGQAAAIGMREMG